MTEKERLKDIEVAIKVILIRPIPKDRKIQVLEELHNNSKMSISELKYILRELERAKIIDYNKAYRDICTLLLEANIDLFPDE